jgi:hypothetical protein
MLGCMSIEGRAEPLKDICIFSFPDKAPPPGQKAKANEAMPEQCSPVGKAHRHALLDTANRLEPRLLQQRENARNRRAVRDMRFECLYRARVENRSEDRLKFCHRALKIGR